MVTSSEPSPAGLRHDLRQRVAELAAARSNLLTGPSPGATEQQHPKGKLTVRERLELLFDAGSFREIEGFRRHRAAGFGLEHHRPTTGTGTAPRCWTPSPAIRTGPTTCAR
ncbi:carboxyl transferase domain-containing protein [Amycolatopsis sp. DG1A-15b]|uniref:carboxyl transferase domain-containing protein n=1 Tax=Amycolatopsis sp. DG1A-15b TaxID=3052846 RepID=UPI00255B5B55|nr:carboxyl transferase domain-containing protein [Amycolatopsis sp. DG1A-15b]WIX92226.1 carboxyl transferase domain-containing protein [Amycolatopsis sp. DG1A-15b]